MTQSTSIVPTIELAYGSLVNKCGTLKVDASNSQGSGGRAMYFVWTVWSFTGANTTYLDKYLETINPKVRRSTRRKELMVSARQHPDANRRGMVYGIISRSRTLCT